MRRSKNIGSNTLFLLVVLFAIGVGIAYAVLTEQLTINNTVSYDAMKWDVGFTSAEDGYEPYGDAYVDYLISEYGSLEAAGYESREDFETQFLEDFFNDNETYATSTATISADKKTLTANCDLGVTSKKQYCAVKATIANNSTFNVALSEAPIITYDDTYVGYSDMWWLNNDLYGFGGYIVKGQTIEPGESADFIFFLYTKELTEDMLPSSELSLPITIEVNFEEVDYSIRDLAMVRTYDSDYGFWNDAYRSKIKKITFENKINIPSNVVASWDISLQKNGSVMSYVVPNTSDSTYYDLYIQSDEQLYANLNMTNWFYAFQNVDSINGLELLDTRYTVDMSYMFRATGDRSSIFTLDVSSFDTSQVTDMSGMFYFTGSSSTQFNTSITIRNPNTMYYGSMFWEAATTTGSQITVNYTYETSDLVDKMIATKNSSANVVKGTEVY